jgi:conjugative transfer pilus assembly protein TraH
MLEWGVRQGVIDSVIADTDELVALTLAYQMLNDLTRTIDFTVTNAERGATVAGRPTATTPMSARRGSCPRASSSCAI